MTKPTSESSEHLRLIFNDNGNITISSEQLSVTSEDTNQIKNALLFNVLSQFEKDQEIPKDLFETLAIFLKFSQLLIEEEN